MKAMTDRHRLRAVLGIALAGTGLALLPLRHAQAQELNCRVSVDFSQLSGSDFDFLGDLEGYIDEYLNEHRWTEDRFNDYERIDCNVQLYVLESLTLTSFRARMVVASRRPIYGTMQSTTVVQINDAEFEFSYTRGAPLIHDLERYDPLTSILDFYAFIILGYDYDTFSELGGTRHFERARRVADIAQSQNAPGWSALGGTRSRASLITQLLDARFRPLRRAYFMYYLNGLDRFVVNPEVARSNVLEALQTLDELSQELSRQYAIDLFFTAKSAELAAIFMDSELSNQAYGVLSTLDPSNSNEYNELVN